MNRAITYHGWIGVLHEKRKCSVLEIILKSSVNLKISCKGQPRLIETGTLYSVLLMGVISNFYHTCTRKTTYIMTQIAMICVNIWIKLLGENPSLM